MKKGRNIHASKTKNMRKSYLKSLTHMYSNSTTDESLDFQGTEKDANDNETSKTTRKRPVALTTILKEYIYNRFKEIIFLGIIAIIGLVITFFVYDSKIAFAKFETLLSQFEKDLSDYKTENDKLSDSNKNQDISIMRNDEKIINLNDKINRIETKLDRLHESSTTKH